MINKSLTYDELYQEQLELLKKKYDDLSANFKMLERRANVSEEDARLARTVVVEYANALTISKEENRKIKNEIDTVIKDDFLLNSTKLTRIKKILKSHNDISKLDIDITERWPITK